MLLLQEKKFYYDINVTDKRNPMGITHPVQVII